MKNFSTTVDTMGRYESDLLPIDPENPNPMPGGHQGPGVKPIGYQDPMPGGSQGGAGSNSGGSDGNSGSNSDGASGAGDSGATNTIAGTETGNGDNMTVDTGSDGTGSGGASDSTGNSGPQNGSPDIDKVGENMYDDGSGDSLEENTNPTGKKLSKPSKKDKQEKDGAPLNPIPHVPQTDTVAPGQTLEPPGQQPSDKKEDGGTAQEGQNDEEQLAGTDNVTNAENEEQETLAESDAPGEAVASTRVSQANEYRQRQWENLGTMTEYKCKDTEMALVGKGRVSAGVKPTYLVDQVLFTQGEIENKVIVEGEAFTEAKNKFCFVTSLVNIVSSLYTDITGKRANKDSLVDTVKKAGKTTLSFDKTRNIIGDNGRVNDTIAFLGMLTDTLGLSNLKGKWTETRIDGFSPKSGRYTIYKTGKVDGAGHFSSNVYAGNEVYDVYDGKYKMLDEVNNAFTCGNGIAPVCQTRVYDFRFGY